MATCILATLFPGVVFDHVPAMPGMPFVRHAHRDKHLFEPNPSLSVLGAIHKLLTRKEMLQDETAMKAVGGEVADFRKINVWDESAVQERSDRIAQAKREGTDLHVAQLMSIFSIKHWEVPSKRKHKARVVFRGDQIFVPHGGAAQFGQLYSAPTNIQAINLAIFFGMVWGNVIRVADATKAFLQAELMSLTPPYVELPPEMWLPHIGGDGTNDRLFASCVPCMDIRKQVPIGISADARF